MTDTVYDGIKKPLIHYKKCKYILLFSLVLIR